MVINDKYITTGCPTGTDIKFKMNARPQDPFRDKTLERTFYASFGRVYARIFTKNHLIILYYLMNESLKFHKDQSIRCRDIRKTILTFV